MAKKVFEAAWSWKLRVNTPNSWRERLGEILDRLATRIDGRVRVVYRIDTTPPLPRQVLLQAIATGHQIVKLSLDSACRCEAEERVFRQAYPELFHG